MYSKVLLRYVPYFEMLFLVILQMLDITKGLDEVKEYCERETFEAACGDDEVILMTSAVYGRMRIGRCVKKDYDNVLGCSSDVLPQVDMRCSGRRSCSLLVTELHSSKNSMCPTNLLSYLEASYKCVKVAPCQANMCQGGNFLKLSPSVTSGFIGSVVTTETGCGGQSCPWVLEPGRGQRFNLTFFNFLPSNSRGSSDQCHRFASVVDKSTQVSTDVTVCGQASRVRHMVTSDSASVEISVYSPRARSEDAATSPMFLLRYQVLGCRDIPVPAGATAKRDGDFLSVRCNTSQRSWHLTCSGKDWVGETGECERVDIHTAGHRGGGIVDATSTPEGLIMVIGVGVALGVVLGFTFLGIAIVCMRRRRRFNNYERPADPMMSDREIEKSYSAKMYRPEATLQYGPEDAYFTYQTRGSLKTGSGPPQFPIPLPDAQGHVPTNYKATESADGTVRSRDHVYESPNFPQQGVGLESANALNNNNRMDILS